MDRTICCKLTTTSAVSEALEETAVVFAEACMFALEAAKKHKTSDKRKLQQVVYKDMRSKFSLTSNLVIRSIARVCYAIKIAAKKRNIVKDFKSTSIDYDQRIFAYRERSQSVSISTIHGRMHVPLDLGSYQKKALKGKDPTCAKVVKIGKHWFIHIVIDEDPPEKKGGPPLGIDLGIRSIATMSTGKKINGAKVQAIRARYARIRASLQSKGTKGSKRALKRLAGREARFMSWINHNVSRSIIREAESHARGLIRFEHLKGIRESTRSWNKHRNRMMAGWGYYQLQTFTEYKAARVGLETEFVNPAWTSENCHSCGYRGIRSKLKNWLHCPTCDMVFDADLNAAKNIEAGGVGAGVIPAVRNATRIADQLMEFFSKTG